LDRTGRAEQALSRATVVVGYRTYLNQIVDLVDGKRVISSEMRQERKRCEAALTAAEEGETVAVVCSGDPGIYGMAGLLMELADQRGSTVDITVVPGVTAASSTAARLGAPLMRDFATISLSDLLVEWSAIRNRLEHVAAADLVTALYNPRSKRRIHQLEEAVEIFLRHRSPHVPVGIGTAVGSCEESLLVTDLGALLHQEVGMRTTVIIGNSETRVINGRLVTPRGYTL
jgi:precorrin-3B C17-methyltransferase